MFSRAFFRTVSRSAARALIVAGLPALAAAQPAPPTVSSAAPAASSSTPPAAAPATVAADGHAPLRATGEEAFQGLPWGASEAQIAERFAGRALAVPCDATGQRLAELQGEACGGWQVPRYVVAGIPFVLNFHLNTTERRLVRVTLTHQPAEAALDDSRWSEQHRALRRLLSQRYGSPETTDVHNDSAAYSAHARWRRGHTVIELQSLLVRRASSRPAHEQVQVVYSSVLHGEAGKL